MEVRLTLRPGQRGTKKLVARYGDRLICVRYRYDEVRRRRYKTVELIEEEGEWAPSEGLRRWDRWVGVRVGWDERRVCEDIRIAGGVWDRRNQWWRLRYRLVRLLKLEDRMVELR